MAATPEPPRSANWHPSRLLRRVRCLGVTCLLLGLAHPTAARDGVEETQIKAAFLYNFTKFIDWPPDHFADSDSPIVMAVASADLLVRELRGATAQRSVNGRSIVVEAIDASGRYSKMPDVVYVAAGEEASFADMMAKWRASGVLTVGESDRFAASGGMITFVRRGKNVRFRINLESTRSAGISMSSKLLSVAESVEQHSG